MCLTVYSNISMRKGLCVYLHSCTLHRSTQVKGGLHWFLLQESDEHPRERPCMLTWEIPSRGWLSSGMSRPLRRKSLMQPAGGKWKRGFSGIRNTLLSAFTYPGTKLNWSFTSCTCWVVETEYYKHVPDRLLASYKPILVFKTRTVLPRKICFFGGFFLLERVLHWAPCCKLFIAVSENIIHTLQGNHWEHWRQRFAYMFDTA